MHRFDCPKCNKSLRFRVLRHVPRSDGQLAFSCAYCDAILGYSKEHTALGNMLWGTRLRAALTYIALLILLSITAITFGHTVSLAVLAAVVVAMLAARLLSRHPAYRTLGSEGRPGEP
jgi:hypothetical protein